MSSSSAGRGVTHEGRTLSQRGCNRRQGLRTFRFVVGRGVGLKLRVLGGGKELGVSAMGRW